MTREEFAKGWLFLIAQPWGRRYEGNDEIAKTQRELYFNRFKSVAGPMWLDGCLKMAERNEWPTMGSMAGVFSHAVRSKLNHIGAEEAWGIMSPIMTDEWASVVCTDEMLEAMVVALPLADNKIQARLAFIEKYRELASTLTPPVWKLRQGYDQNGRSQAVVGAMRAGYLDSVAGNALLEQLPLRDDERELANAMVAKLFPPSDIKRLA